MPKITPVCSVKPTHRSHLRRGSHRARSASHINFKYYYYTIKKSAIKSMRKKNECKAAKYKSKSGVRLPIRANIVVVVYLFFSKKLCLNARCARCNVRYRCLCMHHAIVRYRLTVYMYRYTHICAAYHAIIMII